MRFDTWDTLFNALLLMLWYRLWVPEDDSIGFNNPYMAPFHSVTRSCLRFLKPAFFGVSTGVIAGFLIAAVLLLRALIVPAHAAWMLHMGLSRVVDPDNLRELLTFSVLSFAVFFFRLFAVTLILMRPGPPSPSAYAAQMLHCLSRPFSWMATSLRLLALLAFGMILVIVLNQVGSPCPWPGILPISLPAAPHWNVASPPIFGLQILTLAMMSAVGVLPLLQSLMLLMIIGSWVSSMTGSGDLLRFCQEWIELLLGPLRRHRIRLGMFDLTPILYFFVIGFLHSLLVTFLAFSFRAIS